MTTEAAAAFYLAQHMRDMEGRNGAIFNPHNKPLEDLPRIMAFNNTKGRSDWNSCLAMAEDGHVLGSHFCSHEGYAPHDLGVLEGTRDDRHKESYQVHYPDGYVMEFVRGENVESHAKLMEAFERNKRLGEAAVVKEANMASVKITLDDGTEI